MRIGLIVRADKTGLGNQTRNLAKLLDPTRVLIIDSTPFNRNKQYFDTFKEYESLISNGFPDDRTVRRFLYNIDAVVTCELFYSNTLIDFANRNGIRTYNQFNYEFLDNLNNPSLPLPTKFLAPSYWHLEDMQEKYPDRVVYLPPPIDEKKFISVQIDNLTRKGKPRFLHVVGRMAYNDRNGTLDLLKSLKYTKSDFELVLKVQDSSTDLEQFKDPRITIDYSSPENEEDLYRDFDAMILPRRYAGLCLPMNEALMSALPVIMTDIDPNNQVLPPEWLVPAVDAGYIQTRTQIPLYSVIQTELAKKIDWLCHTNLVQKKELAANIALNNYSMATLKKKYEEVIR